MVKTNNLTVKALTVTAVCETHWFIINHHEGRPHVDAEIFQLPDELDCSDCRMGNYPHPTTEIDHTDISQASN